MNEPTPLRCPITALRCPKCNGALDSGLTITGQRLVICYRRGLPGYLSRDGGRERRGKGGTRGACEQRVYLVVEGRWATVHPISKEQFDWIVNYARRHGYGPPDDLMAKLREAA